MKKIGNLSGFANRYQWPMKLKIIINLGPKYGYMCYSKVTKENVTNTLKRQILPTFKNARFFGEIYSSQSNFTMKHVFTITNIECRIVIYRLLGTRLKSNINLKIKRYNFVFMKIQGLCSYCTRFTTLFFLKFEINYSLPYKMTRKKPRY